MSPPTTLCWQSWPAWRQRCCLLLGSWLGSGLLPFGSPGALLACSTVGAAILIPALGRAAVPVSGLGEAQFCGWQVGSLCRSCIFSFLGGAQHVHLAKHVLESVLLWGVRRRHLWYCQVIKIQVVDVQQGGRCGLGRSCLGLLLQLFVLCGNVSCRACYVRLGQLHEECIVSCLAVKACLAHLFHNGAGFFHGRREGHGLLCCCPASAGHANHRGDVGIVVLQAVSRLRCAGVNGYCHADAVAWL
mmetsp:Transcript_2068/g.4653  ORF Transcript_2068/g.4653 Transcript_2068/m.4653 type:complete len:245 (+) Transcript_2068:323-1057(+)